MEFIKIIALFIGLITSPKLLSEIIHGNRSESQFQLIIVWTICWTFLLYIYFWQWYEY